MTKFFHKFKKPCFGSFLVHFPNFGGKKNFPEKPAVTHNFILVSSTMPKFGKNQWYNPKKKVWADGRMEGQKGKKTHFTGPFQLPFGVQKECQKETESKERDKNESLTPVKRNFMVFFSWMEFNCLKMVTFNGWSSTVTRLQSRYEETVYFLPPSPQEFLVLILSTSKRWKAEMTLEPPSGFQPGTPGSGIQHLYH